MGRLKEIAWQSDQGQGAEWTSGVSMMVPHCELLSCSRGLRRSHQKAQNQNKALSWPHLVGAQPFSLSSKPGKTGLCWGWPGGGMGAYLEARDEEGWWPSRAGTAQAKPSQCAPPQGPPKLGRREQSSF